MDERGAGRRLAAANASSRRAATATATSRSAASFTAPAGVYATVERLAGGTYRITERSGMKYVFESVNGTATDTSQKSRLLSISDKNNNTLTLAYSANCGNNLCTVTDGLNRALTFTYVGNRISQISDWSGRSWQYTVDANGDLTTFKNPLAVAGTQPAVTYQYYSSADGAKLAHAMKQYQLPRGNGMRFPPSTGPNSAAKPNKSTARAMSAASSSTNTATRSQLPTKPAPKPPTPITPQPGKPICAKAKPLPTARPPATPTTAPATSATSRYPAARPCNTATTPPSANRNGSRTPTTTGRSTALIPPAT
ncbi:MAG: RHS repeat-associated core domain-containing protein [Rhodocyclaceae bacterium]|nr:MAG: RHS repeat-associated core domain-containing protein [Rhodocyclaceae bacterium]